MVVGLFPALLSLVLAAPFQATSTPPQAQTCPVSIPGNLHFTNQDSRAISAIVFHSVRIKAVGEEVGHLKPMLSFLQRSTPRLPTAPSRPSLQRRDCSRAKKAI
jgi:hypothetical protein